MSKMKIYIENEGKVVFQTGTDKDIAPNTKKDVDILINKLKHNITFLEGVKVGIGDRKELKRSAYKRATCSGVPKDICLIKFETGLYKEEFYLLDEFMMDKKFSSGTVRFVSNSDIYYDKLLLLNKGEKIPFYHEVQISEEDQFPGGNASVVLDLRPAGIYGNNIEPKLFNDGKGNFGKDFKVSITPKYDIQV